MSKAVRELLDHYHELSPDSPNSEILELKSDIERALREAPLTEEEVEILQARFLIEPKQRPRRNRLNRSGGLAGRPSGGNTASRIAEVMLSHKNPNAANIIISRRIASACAKIATYLGPEYGANEEA